MKRLLSILVVFLISTTIYAQGTQNYLLGDVNRDGKVTVTDAMMVVNIILNGYTSFSVSPTAVSIPTGGTATIDIKGGYNEYEVTSSNTDIVTASLSGSTITLTAVASGEATVTVKDVLTMRYVEIPVTVDYALLQVSSSELSLIVGGTGTVEVTSGSGSYSVESSDAEVATAVVDGTSVKVTAVAAGTATITMTDRRSGQTATIEVTVSAGQTSYFICPDDHHPHLIDLGLPSGTKWACCNVDTDHPENQSPTNYGGYYAWGETETKSTYNWSTYTHCDGSENTCHNLGRDIAGTKYDVAHVKWGGSWVMPSYDQQTELRENCTYEWTTMNGVKGGKFTSKKNGASIFLPAAGYRNGSDFGSAGSGGHYWSSTQNPSNTSNAYNLYFDLVGAHTFILSRLLGFTVRPVSRN